MLTLRRFSSFFKKQTQFYANYENQMPDDWAKLLIDNKFIITSTRQPAIGVVFGRSPKLRLGKQSNTEKRLYRCIEIASISLAICGKHASSDFGQSGLL